MTPTAAPPPPPQIPLPEYTPEYVMLLDMQRVMLEDDRKWAGARGGQGAGKTTAWCWFAWDRLEEYPRANHVVVGATYGQVRDGFFGNFRDLLVGHGLVENRDFTFRTLPSPRITIKETGAVLHSWTAEAVHRLRGVNVQTLILEEPQTWGPRAEEAWIGINGRLRPNELTQRLYPKLVPKGRLSFNPTTVFPGHWLYELVEGRWPLPEWNYTCYQLKTTDNELLLEYDPGYVDNLRISMSPDRWPVEIDGEYPRAGGGVYRNYEPAVHAGNFPDGIPPVDYVDMTKPLLWTHDFNVALMCSVIAQPWSQRPISNGWVYPLGKAPHEEFVLPIPGWQRRIIRVLGEIAQPDGSAEGVARAFVHSEWGRIAKVTGVVLYGDPSGNNRNQGADASSSARTNWRAIQTALTKASIRWSMQVPDPHPPVVDRINETNGQMFVGDGTYDPITRTYGRVAGMTIHAEACPTLVKDFQQVKYDRKGGIEKLPGTLLTHASDAFGYLCYRQRTLAREADARRNAKPFHHMQR